MDCRELLKALKRGAGGMLVPKKSRSRGSNTKHNTVFIAGRHHHNARVGKEVYFIVPATVPLLWKCLFKKVNCWFCVAPGKALLSSLTDT